MDTTPLYAVIGHPVAHSKSPAIHRAFAAQTGHALDYILLEGTPGGFAAAVDAFRARGGLGLNVTAPFKLDAFRYATGLDADAREAGAVNCLAFEPDGQVSGANYDGVGLLRDIEHNLRVPLRGKRVLLLGAGGAARGALRPLLAARPAELVVANRTQARAAALLEPFAGQAVSAAGLNSVPGRFDVVINATSASMDAAPLPLPDAAFAPGCLAYDMVYGRGLTPFLRRGKEAGAALLADGVGMLVEQAAEAFARWRSVRPLTQDVIRALTVPLA